MIRFYQPYVWGSPEWERAYGGRNLSETANSTFKDHHGRFSKGSIKVLGRNKIALALAFFVDAVNTRLIISMPTDFFERWTGSAPTCPTPTTAPGRTLTISRPQLGQSRLLLLNSRGVRERT
ncbi:MAG: hypothetical protein IPL36_06115 [Nigerium sp.]|nr:hypothetical protein [Nigerium sp.]